MLLTHSVSQNSFPNPNWWKILNFWISNDTFFLNTLWYLLSYLEPYLALRSAVSWLKIQGGTFKTIQSRIKQKVMSKGRGKKRSFQKVFFSFVSFRSFISKNTRIFYVSLDFIKYHTYNHFANPSWLTFLAWYDQFETPCVRFEYYWKNFLHRETYLVFVITCTFLKVCQKEICSKSFLQSTFAR